MGEMPSIIGPYRIVRPLGEGGMGAVFEAVHQAIERRVAIKVLRPEFARNAEFTARFFNEARAVNLVAHPGLVQISDYGQQPDGTAYIVMEFLDGESLARRLARLSGRLSSSEVIYLGWQLADSLAAAHAKNIVHRDLKPDNVMIVLDPQMANGERTKLVDFGIAKVSEREAAPRFKTRTDQVMGTPAYMSPEQCAGAGGVDAKSDVYSLGVMLFELLAGQPPFVAEGGGQVMGMHMFVPPPLLSQLVPTVPAPLADLVQRLLAKNKDERPTMRQVAVALDRLAEQNPLPKRSGSIPVQELPDIIRNAPMQAAPQATSTLGLSAAQTLQRGPRGRLLGMTIGTTLVVGAVALAIISLVHRTPERQLTPGAVITGTTTNPNGSPLDMVAYGDSVAAIKPVPPRHPSQVESGVRFSTANPPRPGAPASLGDVGRKHIAPASPLPTSKKRPIYAKPPIEK